jgi:Xaa-Pro aminopeptidase
MAKSNRDRIRKLQQLIKKENLDALLVHELPQVRYLCGYSGSNGMLIAFEKDAYFLTDFRYKTQVAKEVKGTKKILAKRDLISTLPEVKKLGDKNIKVGFLDEFLTTRQLFMLKHKLTNIIWVPTRGLVESLMVTKDAEEIKKIEAAVEISDTAFERILQVIEPGVREIEVAAELEYQMKMLGSEKPAFDTIVASGHRSAMPHGIASSKKIKKGDFVTLDFGAIVEGYASDITRTVVVGKATSRQKKIYNLVKRAQASGTNKAKAGMDAADLDKHVRGIISRAGYEKNFGHGLGHGLGLLVHDQPRVSPLSEDKLKPNMVVTIEPGIYIEGWGGVRIEDDVVITRRGCRILNKADKSLLEL